jgi:hypothetical protein
VFNKILVQKNIGVFKSMNEIEKNALFIFRGPSREKLELFQAL